jgi:hypothetical protein
MLANFRVQSLSILLRVQKAPYSVVGPDNGYSDQGFSQFVLAAPEKFGYNALF